MVSKKKSQQVTELQEAITNAQAEAMVQGSGKTAEAAVGTEPVVQSDSKESAAPQERKPSDRRHQQRRDYRPKNFLYATDEYLEQNNRPLLLDSKRMIDAACNQLWRNPRFDEKAWRLAFTFLFRVSKQDAAGYAMKYMERLALAKDEKGQSDKKAFAIWQVCKLLSDQGFTRSPVWINRDGFIETYEETCQRLIRVIFFNRKGNIKANYNMFVNLLVKGGVMSADQVKAYWKTLMAEEQAGTLKEEEEKGNAGADTEQSA